MIETITRETLFGQQEYKLPPISFFGIFLGVLVFYRKNKFLKSLVLVCSYFINIKCYVNWCTPPSISLKTSVLLGCSTNYIIFPTNTNLFFHCIYLVSNWAGWNCENLATLLDRLLILFQSKISFPNKSFHALSGVDAHTTPFIFLKGGGVLHSRYECKGASSPPPP